MNDSFEQQIGETMVKLVIVTRAGNHFGKMCQNFNSIFRILIADLAELRRFKGNLFERDSGIADFRFRQDDVERGRADDEMLADFHATRGNRFAGKEKRVSGRVDPGQLKMVLVNINLQMPPRDLRIPRNSQLRLRIATQQISSSRIQRLSPALNRFQTLSRKFEHDDAQP